MPSALEKIKKGIETEDWALVDDGYYDLTGNRVRVRGKKANDIIVDDVQEAPAKKPRGRPRKLPLKEMKHPQLKPGRKPIPTVETKTKQTDEEREQVEAKTERVQIGRKPAFVGV